jgi:hypothetical protein
LPIAAFSHSRYHDGATTDMSAPNVAEQRKHRIIGQFLIAIAVLFLLLGILTLFIPNFQWTLIFAILACVFGNYAFRHFEKVAELKSLKKTVQEVDLFSAELKNGQEVNVHLEVHYPSDQDPALTLKRINNQLLRNLNRYLSNLEALSSDPYTEIDTVLQTAIEPLCKELDIESITIQTINVKTASTSTRSGGLYLGES